MMKRKFALFLAAAMVAASAPTNVFAAISNNYLSKSGLSVPNYTLFYEDGVATGSTGGAVTGNEEKIEYWINGSNLIIELTNNVSNGMTGSGTFKVELENAKWFFRNNTEKTLTYQLDAGGTQEISEAVAERLNSANYDGIAYDASTKTITGTSKVNTDNYFGTTLPAESTFDVTKGVYADRKYFRLNKATPSEVPYMMQISSADDASATVVILGDTEAATSDTAKRRIVIPLVVRSTGSGEVRVSITNSGTSVATNSFLLAQGAAARTRTTVNSIVTSRTDFKLEDLAIKEQRIGSIKPGASFELIAPSGYYFGSLNNVQLYVDLGLTWASGFAGLGSNKTVDENGNEVTPDYTIGYRTRNNRQDSSVVEVKLIGILMAS